MRGRSVHHVAVAQGVALAVLGLLGTGCWYSKSSGETLQNDVSTHERRIHALEESLTAQRERLEAALTQADTKLAELQRVLEQATQVVTRNSADLGAQVEQLRGQVSAAEGQAAELRHALETLQQQLGTQQAATDQRIEQLTRRVTGTNTIDQAQIPADRNEHYATAYRAFQARDFTRSRALFSAFIERYAADENADNAQYWMGASFLEENQPARALGEFQKVLQRYGTSDAVDETLWDMAEAFYRLHACRDARDALDTIIRDHARSQFAAQAREKKRAIERAPRGYCTS